MSRIAITTGDADGVGPEITAKALRVCGADFVVFRSSKSDEDFRDLKRVTCASLEEARKVRSRLLIEVVNDDSPAAWVEDAIRGCQDGFFRGMVTGPLSKTLIAESGRRDLGHTEILQRLTGVRQIFQGYLGEKFNVVLMTAHLPLAEVRLTKQLVRDALAAAAQLRRWLPGQRARRPLALLGFNPHAGESGLLGSEEKRVLRPAMPAGVAGPLVPDAAFAESNWKKYSVFVACYHDQGLIPFKMIHGKSSGVQVSLGLPFIRTSVDHGTAKDIAGRGIADPGSMIDAISWCTKLTKRRS